MGDRVLLSPITLFEGIFLLIYPCALADKRRGHGREGGREGDRETAYNC